MLGIWVGLGEAAIVVFLFLILRQFLRLQYPQNPLFGIWSKLASVLVEHQCLPSGSSSVMQARLNFPLNLKGKEQGTFRLGLGLSLVVRHFWPSEIEVKKRRKMRGNQMWLMVKVRLILWNWIQPHRCNTYPLTIKAKYAQASLILYLYCESSWLATK